MARAALAKGLMWLAGYCWQNESKAKLEKENIVATMLQQLSRDLAEIVAEANDSIVRVEARRRLPATGIAWSENLIVTAHHVVEFDEDIQIGLADGSRVSAKLIGRDPRNDLALLQVDSGLTAANWAAGEELQVGNLALAVGRPRAQVKAALGLISGLVSPEDIRQKRQKMKRRFAQQRPGGKLKGKGPGQRRPGGGRRGRWKAGWEGSLGRLLPDGFIQTDVTMYPGFSGGALLGTDGVVHGMNTSGFGAGISIAVPAASIGKSVAALLADGEIQSGYLGIGLQSAQLPEAIAEALEQETGLLIVSVEAESPAARAGLLVGDTLTALAGETLEDVDELQMLLSQLRVGSEVELVFVRGGELKNGALTVGAR